MADLEKLASLSWRRLSKEQRKAVLMVMSHLGMAAEEFPRAKKAPKFNFITDIPLGVMCETIFTADMDCTFVSEEWYHGEDGQPNNAEAIHGSENDGIIAKVIYNIITLIENETSK